MDNVMQHPLLVFVVSFIGLWATEWIGAWFRKWRRHSVEDLREDFGLIVAATLTLLALIIGFSFPSATRSAEFRSGRVKRDRHRICSSRLAIFRRCGESTRAVGELPGSACFVLYDSR